MLQMPQVGLAPNKKIYFVQSKNLKFGKLFHMEAMIDLLNLHNPYSATSAGCQAVKSAKK